MYKKTILYILFAIILASNVFSTYTTADDKEFWNLSNTVVGMINGISLNTGAGAPTYAAVDDAYYLDGTLDYFVTSANPYDVNANPFTISMWIKINNTGGLIISNRFDVAGNDNKFQLYLNGGNLTIQTKAAGAAVYLYSKFQPSLFTWYHIAVTRDGANCIIYLNGTPESGSCDAGDISANKNWVVGDNDGSSELTGYVDDIFIAGYAMTQQNITDLINRSCSYNESPCWGPPVFPSVPDTLNITSTYPSNNSQFNNITVDFNISVSHNLSYNCSFYLDGALNYSWSNQTNNSLNRTLNLTPGTHHYHFFCEDSNVNETSANYTFYIDIVNPAISTNFQNLSFYFLDNLTATFNFSDNFYLNSYNITIDGVQISSNENLTGTFYQVNLTTNISALSAGSHILGVRVADGHTAFEIPDYDVSTGLFNNKLKYIWYDNSKKKSVEILHKDSSIFDTFETKKSKDRYTWNFTPSDKLKSKYTFTVIADDKIRIIKDESTELQTWLTFGSKWLDFNMFGERPIIDIERISPYEVEVEVSNLTKKESQQYKSIGDLNIIEVNYTFYKLNASVTYQPTLFEGSYTPYLLYLYMENITSFNHSAALYWYNETKTNILTNLSNDSVRYNSTFLVPFVNDTYVNWTYFFNVSGYSFNISGNSSFVQMNITNCTAGDYVVLNYTLFDEETLLIPTGVNATISTYLTLKPIGIDTPFYSFSVKWTNTTLLICLPNQTLNQSSYILDALTEYSYTGHVNEFHYIENFTLNKNVIPKEIHLRDLETTESTSFIVSYQNEQYLYVEGVVIDLLRQYIANDGEFLSVEHAKTDEGGQTRLHFVEEDVIYKAHVWFNGVLQYTTSEFQALCQTTPCQINLRKSYEETDQVSQFENLIYEISSQEEFIGSKIITFDYSTVDGTSSVMIMNVTQTTSLLNNTICSTSQTSSSGSLVCTIPLAYYNSTYTARVYKDGDFMGWQTYSSNPDANDIFGVAGLFLAGLGYLTLAFMGIGSPIASIFFGLIGLIFMGAMNLFISGSPFGIGSSIIWLLIAGGILIYKFQDRRVQ